MFKQSKYTVAAIVVTLAVSLRTPDLGGKWYGGFSTRGDGGLRVDELQRRAGIR